MSDASRTLHVDAPMRLDAFLARADVGCSRRVLRALVADGVVRVNGRRAAKGARVVAGDVVTLPRFDGIVPEADLPVTIVHVDADVVVVAKPGGMPGHALDPRQTGTVAAFLAARFPETAAVGDALSSGLVHRLDTGTSGLLVAARHATAHARLRAAFRAGAVTKRYLALVGGTPPATTTTVTHALAHDGSDRGRMRVARPGDRAWPARSEVTTLARGTRGALVGVTIRTGVTHQVRAHLATLGCAVVGDARYGGADAALPRGRHALHAAGVTLPQDAAAAWSLWSPLPADLAAVAAALGIDLGRR